MGSSALISSSLSRFNGLLLTKISSELTDKSISLSIGTSTIISILILAEPSPGEIEFAAKLKLLGSPSLSS